MYRQSSNRAQRSKGIKIKHVLQICLLLAVCFWLIYQVKHSHDKKKEFDESDLRTSLRRESDSEIIKLGRKDLHPRLEETVTKNEKHDEAEEEQETTGEEDVEEDKHEEVEQEEKKAEEKEEGMEGGDDVTDEHEQEKSDAEGDQEEESVDEDKESGENESGEKDSEDINGQMEKEGSLEDSDHDGDDRSAHEAREELYKADDASSAVTHDTQILNPENENGSLENSDELPETDIVELKSKEDVEEIILSDKRTESEVEDIEMAKSDNQSNMTTSEANENVLDKSKKSLLSNTTMAEGSDDHVETSNNSTEVRMEIHDSSLQNETESNLELNHGQNNVDVGTTSGDSQTTDLEQANNSTFDVDNNHFESNSTMPVETKDS